MFSSHLVLNSADSDKSWYIMSNDLNKFATQYCKRFPPYLNSVSTLPCDTQSFFCENSYARKPQPCPNKK